MQSKDQKYDKKRKRNFQDSWKDRFPWVSQDEDGLMICSHCRRFPDVANKSGALFKGTSYLKIDLSYLMMRQMNIVLQVVIILIE